jgi:acyl-coenzyme A synthetase/AMP-(fatty) acid ligase
VGELLSFLAARLPPERVPRRVELVEALPKNANGKLIRRRLREWLEREYCRQGSTSLAVSASL